METKEVEIRLIIDKVLALVGQRFEDRRLEHEKALSKYYNIATEARASEAFTAVAIIQGLRNDLYNVQKQIGL